MPSTTAFRRSRRLHCFERLPRVRVWIWGPKWRRLFDVRHPLVSEIHPEAARYHPPRRRLLVYDLEPDVRELVCVPLHLHSDRVAMWSDPREQLGLALRAGGRR